MAKRFNDTQNFPENTRLSPDLNDRFFRALWKKDHAVIRAVLEQHPEAATARDFPQHNPIIQRRDYRLSEEEYGSALWAASYVHDLETIDLLLQKGANPNDAALKMGNALHAAENDIPTIQKLLAHNVSTSFKDGAGLSPPVFALAEGHMEAAAFYHSIGAFTQPPQEILNSFLGDVLRQPIQKGLNLAGKPLAFIVRQLGADINAQDNQGTTPLMRISGRGAHSYLPSIMLGLGAKPDIQDNDGNTALHHFALKVIHTIYKESDRLNVPQFLKALARHEANPDIRNNEGKTALDILVKDDAMAWSRVAYTPITPFIEALEKMSADRQNDIQRKRQREIEKIASSAFKGATKVIKLPPKIKVRRGPR